MEYDHHRKISIKCDFLEGKKNGYGKETYCYDDKNINFEGIYLNGFRRKGKEYMQITN